MPDTINNDDAATAGYGADVFLVYRLGDISGISGALSGLSNNGKGTPGHIRIPEAEQMSDELVAFINRLGEKIWK